MPFGGAWIRVRGYERWLPATATVRSTALSRVGGKFAWQAVCEITWQDSRGAGYSGRFKAFEESPLYQLSEGDAVGIRFNPENPTEFYVPGLIQSNLTRAWRLGLYGLMVTLLVVLALVVLLVW